MFFIIGSDQINKVNIKGVLDRFEDNNQAVLLIEEVNEEIIVPKDKLPLGSKEGTWFAIRKKNNEVEIITIDRHLMIKENKNVKDLIKGIRQN